ncbi:hypothetical protein ACFXTO_003592 [Malus domestica]
MGSDSLKYRNPKYLSLLNHLRFYLPDVYPKLDKILFLDDDIVVQKDLTPIWSVDLQGNVNGAVETCKESFHRYDKYLNFSNPLISDNFDSNACGWAFGMNIFDLKEWRKRNITGIYHRWQDMNEDRTLWKLGTLPPGLITFYNLTFPLDRGWHALGLGYDPAFNKTAIENAAVIHYNGNYKPWLDLAISKYKAYWSRYAVHGGLIKTGFESCTSVANSAMDFYVKTGELGSALCVFNGMRSRDGVSWNIVVCGCLDQGDLEQGLWWFNNARVYADGFQFQPNNSTLVLVIQACRRLRDKCEGLIVHGYVIRGGFSFVSSVQNSLLSLYAEEGDMDSARNVFDEMRQRDVISWSVMIGGFVRCEEALIGMQMFRRMVAELGIEPDGVTMVSVLKACTNLKDLTMGQSIHGLVICRGLDCDMFVGNSLIDMYSKCSDADSASKVFEAMPRRNKVSWNSILSGFVFNEKHLEALSLFFSMGNEGIEADEVTLVSVLQTSEHLGLIHCKSVHCVTIRQGYESNELLLNSLMDAYAKCNDVELAWKLFREMKKRDVVSWSNMIGGFASCGRPDEAIAVFNEMMRLQGQDQKPNEITIINLFDACSASAELKRSKWAHGIAIRRGLAAQVAVGTAIVDMYSKCGAIGESRKAFGQILEKNVVSWSAMIAAYGMNGLGHEALALLAEMKLYGLKPNAVTILSVLSACSHGGLVEEGLSLFNSMVQDHGIEQRPEHYTCVVDMLARAGKLVRAMEFIKKIPESFMAARTSNAWGALLSACRSYRNSKVGFEAASRVLELVPENSAGYLLASSIYAANGLWVDAASMRRLVKERRVRVVAGYSLVHVGNKACRFVAGDGNSHSKSVSPSHGNMHSMLELLHACMIKTGNRNIVDDFDLIE